MANSYIKMLSIVMVFVLSSVWYIQPLCAQTINTESQKDSQNRQKLIEIIHNSVKLAKASHDGLPRDTFDFKQLITDVGADPARLFVWVRDHTFLVPYQGILRKAQGVLMDRVGNSLDRTLLLADLLKMTGKEVRLCHATLTEDQLMELTSKIRKIPESGAIFYPKMSDEQFSTYIKMIGDKARIDSTLILSDLQQSRAAGKETLDKATSQINSQMTEISTILSGFSSQSAVTAGTGYSDLSDHWWLQYQSADNWIDLDTALPESKPGEPFASSMETIPIDQLPKELYATVELQVVIERLGMDGTLTETTALSHEFIPADIIGKQVVFSHHPIDIKGGDSGEDKIQDFETFKNSSMKVTQWLPTLKTDNEIWHGDAINLSGLTEPYKFKREESKFADAVKAKMEGASAGEAVKTPEVVSSVISAEWLDFVIRENGKESRTIRRQVFDLLGPVNRQNEKNAGFNLTDDRIIARFFGLAAQTELLLFPCQLSPYYVDDLFTRDFIRNSDVLEKSLNISESQNPDLLFKQASNLDLHNSALYQYAMIRTALHSSKQDLYLSSPNIIAFHSFMKQGKGDEMILSKAFDIIDNGINIVPWTKNNPFLLRVEQGILDTNIESLMMNRKCDCKNVMNTSELFSAQRNGWKLISSLKDLDGGLLSGDLETTIRNEINAGQIVIAPTKSLSMGDEIAFGWWRIDPKTGQTIGMMEGGWGVAKTERAVTDFYLKLKLLGSVTAFQMAVFFCLGQSKTTLSKAWCMVKYMCDITLFASWLSGGTLIPLGVAVAIEMACRFSDLLSGIS